MRGSEGTVLGGPMLHVRSVYSFPVELFVSLRLYGVGWSLGTAIGNRVS
jgi:hypothetical protein